MEELLVDLNNEQKEAVTHKEGPLLIVAGAGTGKTTVVTKRLAWLILNNFAAPEQVLAMTFTDKAAGEMEERVDRLLPYGYVDLWVSTFHAFCERVLKAHAIDIGLSSDFKLLNQTEQWLLLRQNLEKLNLDYYRPLGNPTKFIHALLKHFSRAKDEAVRPAEYLEYVKNLKLNADAENVIARTPHLRGTKQSHQLKDKIAAFPPVARNDENNDIHRLEEVANAYHVYQQLLLDNNALDFGDLINYTLELFQKRPKILEQYRQQFKYILVDEFQDTNWAQYELIKILAAPSNNLAVVGDDDQSIYKFRGASVSNILQFKQDFPSSQGIVLVKNYRNKQNILDTAYNFIQQNNPYRLEYKLKSSNLSKKLSAQTGAEGIFQQIIAEDYLDEAKKIAATMIDLHKKDKDASWNDYAVLVRANSYAEPLMKVFSDIGLPFNFVASRGLYAKTIVMDILAYLKLLDNYHESPALYRVLNLPVFALPVESVIVLNHYAFKKSVSLYEALKNASMMPEISAETRNKINDLLAMIGKHTALARTANVSKVTLAFLEDSGYLKKLVNQDSQQAQTEVNFLRQFYKKIQDFETAALEPTVKNFMETFKLELEAGEEGNLENDLEQGPEAVKIMTIHSAKGLEFRYVFLANMVDKRFPATERRDPIELPTALVKEILPEGDVHLQEERRLFYVALTRAKEGVFLTRALDYGGVRAKKPSRFLYELGLVKEEGKKQTKKKESADDFQKREPLAAGKSDLLAHLPPYFSYTQYRAFKSCPLQYKFAHILKIPVQGRAPFSFGHSLHRALYDFYHLLLEQNQNQQAGLFGAEGEKKQNIPTLEDLLTIYKKRWVDDWYDNAAQKKDYFTKGEKTLRLFYEQNKDNFGRPVFLEQPFFLKFGNCTVKGAVDRIDDLGDNTVEIVDYKTGKAKDEETLDEAAKEQLVIYQIACQELLKKTPARLTFYYLESGVKLPFLGTDKDKQKTKDNFEKTFEEIKRSDFVADPSPHKCKFCDFKEVCEFREL
ncbi:MAG: UvrD-helicase domain-containing protein [bacterium]|nr:UvrD-helicase domain-containing protein [bacterium]